MASTLAQEIFKRDPFNSLEQEAFLNIMRTHAQLTADVEEVLKSQGLSVATYNVLRILRGAGKDGRMCHEIGKHMVTRVPDVTRLVDRLERTGLATRERCSKDRRVVHVRISAKGEEVLRLLDEPVMKMHKEQLGHMTATQLRELSDLLTVARHRPVSAETSQL